jgi:2-oxoglutarate/2-oxoacid ferredoxin oxidoreductase subunit alpha
MRYNILFGGPAGTGPNILTHILGEALVEQGYYVFYSRDYQSLIRGGHNFNVLTFSEHPVSSNDSEIDILVCLDKNTESLHKEKLKEKAITLKDNNSNMYFAGRVFKLLSMDFSLLDKQLKKLEKRYDENIKESKKGYDEETNKICEIKPQKIKSYFMNGNQGISQGAIKSGLDIYYAYPMTPATSVLSELAEKQIENNYLVLELENEISVINAAIGSSMTGAKSMVGTSGGGFDLMTESLSLTGIAEIPLVLYLAQRPGPGTGVATYTGQGDLNMARHAGHGEFQRTLFAPGDPKEAQELTSQAFYFSQKYKIPSIILSDKHLGESLYTLIDSPKIIESKKTNSLTRYNSYEKDSEASATEDPEIIKKNIEARKQKQQQIIQDSKNFEQYKIYGIPSSKNVIVSYGSPKGAILDAIMDLDIKFIQVLHLEPFPEIKNEIQNKNVILVENNATGMFADLIAEKTGIFIDEKNKILRYDGRPFLADELKREFQERIK